MSDRFPDATLALNLLPPPAVIKTVDCEAIRSARLTDFVARMAARGITFDVTALETDPGVILQEESSYREMLCKAAINDAARAVLIGYAQGADQDVIYPLVGVRRLVIRPATADHPAVMEDNESFRYRAQIAMEGTAPGLTGGGYASIALRASPEVRSVKLVRAAGGVVNVILQGRSPDGTVSGAAVQAVAVALADDFDNDDPSVGSQLTDVPQVRSAVARPYDIAVRASVPPGPTIADVEAASAVALQAVALSLQLIGNAVPTDALIAAGRSPVMTKFWLDSPATDVVCAPDENPYARSVSVKVSRIDV